MPPRGDPCAPRSGPARAWRRSPTRSRGGSPRRPPSQSVPSRAHPAAYVSPFCSETLNGAWGPFEWRSRCGSPEAVSFFYLEDGEERLLRDLHVAHLLHALLAGLLLLEQLALARDVAAVALGEHVLAASLDGLPRDDARPDRRLDRHVEHLPRDLLAQLLDERPSAVVGEVAVHDQRERIDRLPADEDVDA